MTYSCHKIYELVKKILKNNCLGNGKHWTWGHFVLQILINKLLFRALVRRNRKVLINFMAISFDTDYDAVFMQYTKGK